MWLFELAIFVCYRVIVTLGDLTRRQLERYLKSKRRKSIHFSPEQVYNRARVVVNSIDTEESIDLL